MNLRLLRLAEQEGTAISAALGEDLWKLLKLDFQPPAVLFKAFKGDWGGQCPDEDMTHAGEIEINASYLRETQTLSTATAKRKLVTVYLHEWAHRLTEGHGHDAIFATVNLALLVRASPAHQHLALMGLCLYDFQDHIEAQHGVNLAEAAAFVMRHGIELGNSDLPVSALADEAKARFERVKAQREAALLDQVEDLKRKLGMANQFRHLALVGLVVVTALSFVLRLH